MMRYVLFVYAMMGVFTGMSLFANDASFWYRMAQRYEKSGDTALEELSLKKVLEFEPENLLAQQRLRSIEVLKQRDGKSSIQDLLQQMENTLQTDVSSNQDLQAIEDIELQQDVSKKIAGYEERLKQSGLTDVQKQRLREILARLYFDLGIQEASAVRLKQSIDSFERSIFNDPAFQLSHYELGYLYFRIRELDKGIQSLEAFIELQSDGVLAQSVRETLLVQYIKIARKHFFRKDFDSCLPVLRKIMAFAPQSAEAQQARVFLMDLYYYQGMDNLNLGNFEGASKAFYEAMQTMQASPGLDSVFFAKLSKNAVQPFLKYGQQLFLMDKDYGLASTYFQAVTWLVPGTPESFLAREYMKEINKLNGTVTNPVVYMSNLVAEESKKFLADLERVRNVRRNEVNRQ